MDTDKVELRPDLRRIKQRLGPGKRERPGDDADGDHVALVLPADGRHQFVYPRFGHLLARAPGQV